MRFSDLKPISSKSVQTLEQEIQKNPMFQSIEQFIVLYNQRALDHRNPVVARMATKVLEAYSNISLMYHHFVIASPGEQALKTTLMVLQDLQVLIRLKRIALLLLDENYPLDTKIVFTEERQGRPFVTVINGETGEEELEPYWMAEKVVRSTGDFANNLFTAYLLQSYDEEGTSCYFTLTNLLEIDDSFLEEIEAIVKKNVLKTGKVNS